MGVKRRVPHVKRPLDILKTFFLGKARLGESRAVPYQVFVGKGDREGTGECFGKEFRLVKLSLPLFPSEKGDGENPIKVKGLEVLPCESDEGIGQSICQWFSASIFEDMEHFSNSSFIGIEEPETFKKKRPPLTSAALDRRLCADKISPAGGAEGREILGNV